MENNRLIRSARSFHTLRLRGGGGLGATGVSTGAMLESGPGTDPSWGQHIRAAGEGTPVMWGKPPASGTHRSLSCKLMSPG